MDCKENVLQIYRLLDGGLPAEEEARLLTHLGSCAACRRVHHEAARLGALLGAGTSAAALPEGFEARFAARLERRRAAPALAEWASAVSVPTPVQAAVIALLALALGVAVGVASHRHGENLRRPFGGALSESRGFPATAFPAVYERLMQGGGSR